VLERDLARVRVGQSTRVSLPADPSFSAEGTLRRSASVFDPEDRTLSVWVELVVATKRPLPVGILARLALIVAEPPPTLAVPLSAITKERHEAFLFVRNADGTFERRSVQTGRADNRLIEIKSGLSEGESVAVRGVAALRTAFAALK